MKKSILLLSTVIGLMSSQLTAQTWSAVSSTTVNPASSIETYNGTLFIGTRSTFAGEIHMYDGPTDAITSTTVLTSVYNYDMAKNGNVVLYYTGNGTNSYSTTTGATYGQLGTNNGGTSQIAYYNANLYRMNTGTTSITKINPATGVGAALNLSKNIANVSEAKVIGTTLYIAGRMGTATPYDGFRTTDGFVGAAFGPTITASQNISDFTNITGSNSIYACLAGTGATCGIYKYNGNGAITASITASSYTTVGRCEVYKNKLYYSVQTNTASTNIYVTDTMLNSPTLIATVTGSPCIIKDMIVYNNELYVAGTFSAIGAQSFTNIARLSTPTASISASLSTICGLGSSIITNSSTNTSTFTWYVNGVASAATTNTLSVSPSNPYVSGSLVVKLVVGTGALKDSTTTTITVNASPTVPNITGNVPFCSNTAGITLATSATGVSYSWNQGAGNGSTFATATPGTYTLDVTNASNCTNSALTTLTVYAAPSLSIAAPSGFCSGKTATLTASGANTYTWSPSMSNPLVISVDDTYTVTGTSVDGCVSTETVYVGITQTPTISISGSGSTCGGTFTLTGSKTAGILTPLTYTWTSASSSTVVPSTYTTAIMPSASGVYTLTGTSIGNGCVSDPVTYSVSVLTAPAASITTPSTSICAGSSVVLTANGGTTYSWSSASTQTISVNTTGVYVVTVTAANGCTATASQVVTVNALPVPVITLSGNELSTTSFVTYQWALNTGDIVSATAQTYSPSADGNYTVRVKNSNGCTGTSAVFNYVAPITTGIKELNSGSQYKVVKVDGTIFVTLTKPAHVEVYDLLGKLLYSSTKQNHEITVGEGVQVVRSNEFALKVGL